MGVLKDLEPVWVGEGAGEIETLSVELNLENMKIRCVCGYGPQETQSNEIKALYWSQLSYEVEEAEQSGSAIIIQMDGNLWCGPNLIKGDPNIQNQNGKLFQLFLENYPHLTIVNSLDICEGTLTRVRKTVNREEKSILDFFIICDKILPYVKKMVVDEKKEYILSSYQKKRAKPL